MRRTYEITLHSVWEISPLQSEVYFITVMDVCTVGLTNNLSFNVTYFFSHQLPTPPCRSLISYLFLYFGKLLGQKSLGFLFLSRPRNLVPIHILCHYERRKERVNYCFFTFNNDCCLGSRQLLAFSYLLQNSSDRRN